MRAATPEKTRSEPVRFGQSDASVLLDLVRGLAALVVVGDHWRNIFFIDFPQLTTHRVLWLPLYLLTVAGHQAVIVFFVLSGFLISGSVFRMRASGRWSVRRYALHRLVRLWVVLLPGLLLCGVLDTVGVLSDRAPALYGGVKLNHMMPNVAALLTWPVFLGNLFFLQGILVPTFGSDASLWSLANEFWYYVLFPLGLFALYARRVWMRFLCVTFFAVGAWFLGLYPMLGFVVWMLGVALAVIKPLPFLRSRTLWIVGLLYGVIFTGFARMPLDGSKADLLLGLLTAGFLWTLLSAQSRACEGSLPVKSSRTLARFSYTLYVVHTPILVFLAAFSVGDNRWKPNAAHLAVAVLFLLLTLLLAYGLAALTEFRTDHFRAAAERVFL